MTGPFSSADLALARRIEAGHAHSAAASMPDVAVETIAGGQAIFHQPGSAVTQAIGIGMHGPVDAADLDRLEAFFHSRGSDAVIDLSTLADPGLTEMLRERQYMVREISHVLARRLDPAENYAAALPIRIEQLAAGDFRAWASLVMRGFAGYDDVPAEQIEMLSRSNPWPESFFGVYDGARCAAAAMDVHDGLATLFGDATLAASRGRGLQLALIRHRLARAAQLGCDLATASVIPGSVSNRNYERAGFQLVYARVMLARAG
ncbi:MAG TPA: hypothetical protein VFW44_19190 [Bryobacteraceae bacterium]|nr:hypothetical protein [Bryobacteraceae bacterium]